MTIPKSYTNGHCVLQGGRSAVYVGSTTSEGLAIGQSVSDKVKTRVDQGDRLVVSDLDTTPNLEVGFRQLPAGSHLTVTNRKGEFETSTYIPLSLDASEADKGVDLASGLEVKKVTVQPQDFGTYISLADTSGVGERGFLLTPDGKLQEFLREA